MNILTVDDDPVMLLLLQRMLTKQGHKVIEACDGDDALTIVRNDPPDIMILDWEMPRMKGVDVCRAISSDGSLKRPYIIMLTSRVEKEDRIQGFSSGVDDYLTKPVDVEDLTARVRVGERIVRMQHELNRRAKNAELRFRNLFDNSPSGILQVDAHGTITRTDFIDANRSICTILGYQVEGLTGSSIWDIVHPSDHVKMEKVLQGAVKGKLSIEARLRKRGGDQIWAAMNILDLGETTLIIVDDITKEKQSQQDILMRTMRYRLEEGRIYLAKEGDGKSAMEAFSDAVSAGFDGIALSRRRDWEFRRSVPGAYTFYWLAEKGPEGSVPPILERLQSIVDTAPNHEVLLIDGLDYLYRKTGFRDAFDLVTSIRESAIMKDSIAIISVDPDTMPAGELVSIEKECETLSPFLTTKLSDDLMSLMKAVYLRESRHLEASFGGITEDLGISRPTARKRVNELVSFDYLLDIRRGKNRTLSLSEKGKKVFSL